MENRTSKRQYQSVDSNPIDSRIDSETYTKIVKIKLMLLQALILFVMFVTPLSGHADNSVKSRGAGELNGKGTVCPANSFTGFIKSFSTKIQTQKTFTKLPLKLVELVDPTSEPKPKYSTKHLDKKEIRFPLLLNHTELQKYGLTTQIIEDSGGFSIIETSKGDKSLGHYIEYKFTFQNNCWYLTEVINQST